jgi:hypothetical protein
VRGHQQGHRQHDRPAEGPPLAQPPEGVPAPHELLGDAVQGEDPDQQPRPAGPERRHDPGDRGGERMGQQHQRRQHGRQQQRPPAGAPQAEAPHDGRRSPAVEELLDEHRGDQHPGQDRQAQPGRGIEAGQPGQDAVHHREPGQEPEPVPQVHGSRPPGVR